ncbi:hypothetical protein BJ322DRAFT_1112707 [Thelephora terrestris]|uniref:Uncharacterized protein n=1 Tax=Thelephora terrestris TaxID=56493 RepID=A0A9P6H8N5_9AGAM|nr:hypothetical protein BJ322DRAFT_1112707 [Thelephora terrestris]
MVSTNIIDHADSSDDSAEHLSSAVSPYSPEELAQLVKKLQIENADYRAQLRKFTSGASAGASTVPGSASVSSSSNPLERHTEDFDQLGRSFTVLYEIWPRPTHLSQPFPENLREIGPWHARRYTNEQTKREAIIAEVYSFIPSHFHKFLETSPFFASKFLAGADSMRSYFISNIRKNARDIFPVDVGRGAFAKSRKRSEIPEIMALLQNPNKPGETYPRYPSVIYRDGVIRGNNIFGSSTIVNILKAIFLGPTSVNREAGATRSGPKPLAVRLELTSLTAGSVAMAAILARFILSNDLLFQEVGAESHIKYHEDFNHYKQLILDNFDSPGMTATFNRLNWEVLGNAPPSDDPIVDGDNGDLHNSEEDQMRAELWGEPENSNSVPSLQPPEPSPTPPLPPSPIQAQQPEVSPTTTAAEPEVIPQVKKTRARKGKVTVNVVVEGDVTAGDDTAGAAKPRKTRQRTNRP